MTNALASTFSGWDWLALFGHFLMLSLLAVGGALTTAGEMQRWIVGEKGWLSAEGFASSVALAQAAPGPNVLFVAVVAFNVAGLGGVVAALAGTLLPSSVVAVAAQRWGQARRESLAVRAFNAGMAPLTLGLLLATGWLVVAGAAAASAQPWAAAGLVLLAVGLGLRKGLPPLLPIALGAAAGAAGWV